jgi:prevent-host-death family protein
MKTSSIAETKANLSELVAEVAYTGQSIVITKRGRPMAKLVPVNEKETAHLSDIEGWLDNDDPFFDLIDEIVEERQQHHPRPVNL